MATDNGHDDRRRHPHEGPCTVPGPSTVGAIAGVPVDPVPGLRSGSSILHVA